MDEHDDQCEIVDRPPELAEQFDRIAGDNDARPGYPPWVFDVLVERCALRPGARVLESGAGTGSSRALAQKAPSPRCVEPSTPARLEVDDGQGTAFS